MPPPQLFYLEEQRRLRIEQLATLIQKIYRGWRCRTHYQQMRKSQILIAAWFRGNKVPPHSPGTTLVTPAAGACGLGCGFFSDGAPFPTAKEAVWQDEGVSPADPGFRERVEGMRADGSMGYGHAVVPRPPFCSGLSGCGYAAMRRCMGLAVFLPLSVGDFK